MGRSLAAQHSQGCCDPVLARTEFVGGRGAQWLPRRTLVGLLHRSESGSERTLPCRPIRKRRGRVYAGAEETRSRWRGNSVDGYCLRRQYGQPDMAAHRGHRRTPVVAGTEEGCRLDVPAARNRFTETRLLRPATPAYYGGNAGTHERRSKSRRSEGVGGCCAAAQGLSAPGTSDRLHAAEPS